MPVKRFEMKATQFREGPISYKVSRIPKCALKEGGYKYSPNYKNMLCSGRRGWATLPNLDCDIKALKIKSMI